MMKSIVFILPLIMLFSCSEPAVDEERIFVDEETDSTSQVESEDPGTFILEVALEANPSIVPIGSLTRPYQEYKCNLINNSADTLYPQSWVCSYELMYGVDNVQYEVFMHNLCYANFPTVMKIAPGSSVTQNILIVQRSKNPESKKFRIGFANHFAVGNGFSSATFEQTTDESIIVWSNEVEF